MHSLGTIYREVARTKSACDAPALICLSWLHAFLRLSLFLGKNGLIVAGKSICGIMKKKKKKKKKLIY